MYGEHHQPAGIAFDVRDAFAGGLAAVRVATAPMWLGGLLMWISGGNSAPVGLVTNLLQLQDPGAYEDASAALAAPFAAPGQVAAGVASMGLGEVVATLVVLAVVVLVFGLLLTLLLFALYCWLQPGFIRLHANVLEHGSDDTAPLFSGKDVFWAALGWNALDRLALGAAFCVAAWPGALVGFVGWRTGSQTLQLAGATLAVLFAVPALIYVGLGTYLGAQAVVLEGKRPVQALRRSWALAHSNRFALLFFASACVLLEVASFSGVLLCCVGLLFTAPFAVAITGFARTRGFLRMTRPSSQIRSWALLHAEATAEPAGVAEAGCDQQT